jgi:hypothetical protein
VSRLYQTLQRVHPEAEITVNSLKLLAGLIDNLANEVLTEAQILKPERAQQVGKKRRLSEVPLTSLQIQQVVPLAVFRTLHNPLRHHDLKNSCPSAGCETRASWQTRANLETVRAIRAQAGLALGQEEFERSQAKGAATRDC